MSTGRLRRRSATLGGFRCTGAQGDRRVANEGYFSGLDSRLEQRGFVTLPRGPLDLPVDRTYFRRKLSITKFGVVDTFCIVKCVDANLTPSFVKSFSEQAFTFALKNKIWIPRGCGGGVVVYPLLVIDSVPDGVRSFVEGYCPKHWASNEFPVVLETSSRNLLYCRSTPLWGCAYYRGFRKEAESLFRLE